jgi:hypothetical protein
MGWNAIGNRVRRAAPASPPTNVPSPPTINIAIISNERGVATISGDKK